MISTQSPSIDSSRTDGHELLVGLPEVLTTREAAHVLRCSKAHFCNVLNGVVPGVPPLPYLQLGRLRLVRRATLALWIEQVERRNRHEVISS
jgi:hypothetical protein